MIVLRVEDSSEHIILFAGLVLAADWVWDWRLIGDEQLSVSY